MKKPKPKPKAKKPRRVVLFVGELDHSCGDDYINLFLAGPSEKNELLAKPEDVIRLGRCKRVRLVAEVLK